MALPVFSTDRSVMLLIDVQGRLAEMMYGRDDLFKSLKVLIQAMKILDVPIIWLEQLPDKLGPTREEILPLLDDFSPIAKSSFSCCGEPAFMEQFKQTGRDQVILTGIETHICVCQTGCELIRNGSQVQVVADCVSSRTRENRDIGIRRLMQAGAQITSVEMLLFELLKDAKTELFRDIVGLIK